MSRGKKQAALAIDIGGTKILAALVSPQGDIISQEYCLTLAHEGVEAVINRLLTTASNTLDKANMEISQLEGLGIATAGALDTKRGIVTASPNLPGWHNVPLKDIITEKLGVNVYLMNDANAAALAEYLLGAGRGAHNMIYITVSTGIGGGVIINGRLYSGVDGCAGEIGHMTIDVNGPKCNCGNSGCLEVLASGMAVAKEAITRVRRGESSQLSELVAGKLEDIDARIVGIAASRGDPLAFDIIAKAANYLGVGMVNLVNIFNPERIIVGGGMSHLGDMLLEPARRVVRERAFQLAAQSVSIIPSQLGDNAGVIGAAMFVLQSVNEQL
jgi:glucokinase